MFNLEVPVYELYCLMCGHVWFDPKHDVCPSCGCRDFMVHDDKQSPEPSEGHFEGDFATSPSHYNQYDEYGE